MTTYEVGFATHQGRVRESNQDSVGIFDGRRGLLSKKGLPLFIVADGMGGYEGGEKASQIAVHKMAETFSDHNQESPADAMYAAIAAANKAVMSQASDLPEHMRMGTTIVAATINETTLWVGNVGDSRAYLIRGSEIARLTEDHSLVAEQIKAGMMTEEESYTAPGRNIITRSVGRDEDLEIDVFEDRWRPGDMLVLCSDGLWGVVSDAQIAAISTELTPQDAADKLIEMAMTGQSSDNISVVIIKYT